MNPIAINNKKSGVKGIKKRCSLCLSIEYTNKLHKTLNKITLAEESLEENVLYIPLSIGKIPKTSVKAGKKFVKYL